MTIDRRSFLYAGGLTAAAATPFAPAAHAQAIQGGKSVTDFGVVPNADYDQTAKLQTAITELSRAGQTIILPGTFKVEKLELPSGGAIIGMGFAGIEAQEITINDASHLGLTLQGIVFAREQTRLTGPLLTARGSVNIYSCSFMAKGTALAIEAALHANLYGVRFEATNGLRSKSNNLMVTNCFFEDCASGLVAEGGAAATIANCHFDRCGVGIAVSGSGVIHGNTVTSAREFGLKLGSAKGNGHIVAQSNLIRDCRIGIGVSSSGDDIMVSLNRIAGAKDGAIRAFDGDKLVGPDLTRQSAEAYLNLMVAGNVAR